LRLFGKDRSRDPDRGAIAYCRNDLTAIVSPRLKLTNNISREGDQQDCRNRDMHGRENEWNELKSSAIMSDKGGKILVMQNGKQKKSERGITS
jgi:hypothetical protein